MFSMDVTPEQSEFGSFLSDLIGVNIDLSKSGDALASGGTTGVKEYVAGQVTSNTQVQQLVQTSVEKGAITKAVEWVSANKGIVTILAATAVVGIAIAAYGGLKKVSQ